MSTMLRIVADRRGTARFEEFDLTLTPDAGGLRLSPPVPASPALIFQVPAGHGHPVQPEARRQLAVIRSGSCSVTAAGTTRIGRPGDLLLIDDTVGTGHSSTTAEGFTALMVALGDGAGS